MCIAEKESPFFSLQHDFYFSLAILPELAMEVGEEFFESFVSVIAIAIFAMRSAHLVSPFFSHASSASLNLTKSS